ncbi:MAG: maleylpyruvate isomerase family mycothiol-dependent enzyme [Acidimicrobiales bacterium]
MKRSELKELLNDERQELSSFLTTLTAADWETPSLCDEWSVLDVAGHLASAVGLTRRGLVARNLRYGSGTDGANARAAAAWTSRGPDQIVAVLGDPTRLGLGFFYPAWALCETVVHHQDIRLGLGRPRTIPADRLVVALDVLVKLPFITKAKRHTRKVAMRTTDIDWSHGKGPEVHGPAESLLLALAGRTRAAKGLAGDGTDTLLGVAVN